MQYVYCLLFFYLLSSCGNTGTKKQKETATGETPRQAQIDYVNSVNLTSPKKNGLYSYNEELDIAFDVKKDYALDSVQIFINGNKIASTGSDTRNYAYRIPEGKTGTTNVKVIAWHPGGKQGVSTVSIRVKPDKAPEQYSYSVVRTLPHDPKAYTQGLVYHDGFMYEGTGQYGESSLRKLEIATGKPLSVLSLSSQLFGEGITIIGDKIYQITWRSRKGFIYDLKTFSLESTFTYNSEGWGITTAGDHLVMSDGSNKLYHIVPSASFDIIRQVEVYDNKGEVNQLNELEYVGGLIWANIWLSDRIVAIDPETGAVKGELNMENLLPGTDRKKLDDKDDVLNGIAWDPEKNTFYLTGKRWPKMFEIKINKPNL